MFNLLSLDMILIVFKLWIEHIYSTEVVCLQDLGNKMATTTTVVWLNDAQTWNLTLFIDAWLTDPTDDRPYILT
jgi:hypothetical protein